MNLFPDQEAACQLVKREQFSIVTGGAGTGKSTVVSAIIQEHSRPGLRISLAAPSGKAAKRLAEVTGKPAGTIHRLLEPTKVKGGFTFARNAQRMLDADLIVIDETSMVDISLMASLMDAVSPATKVVLVGDHYQLPPVGPGSPFRDLLASQAVPAAELNIIKRQKDGLIIERPPHQEWRTSSSITKRQGFLLHRPDRRGGHPRRLDSSRASPQVRRRPSSGRPGNLPLRERPALLQVHQRRAAKKLNPRDLVPGCLFRSATRSSDPKRL